MINLSFLEQYGPLGGGFKGNMKMAMEEPCFPDFTIDESSRLINNDIPVGVSRIGPPPSVTINNNDKLVYFPTESVCRLVKGNLNADVYFVSDENYNYNVLSPNRISYPINNFIGACNNSFVTGNKFRTQTVVIGISQVDSEYEYVFYDQNGNVLNASMIQEESEPMFHVYINYDTKQINVVADTE